MRNVVDRIVKAMITAGVVVLLAIGGIVAKAWAKWNR